MSLPIGISEKGRYTQCKEFSENDFDQLRMWKHTNCYEKAQKQTTIATAQTHTLGTAHRHPSVLPSPGVKSCEETVAATDKELLANWDKLNYFPLDW